MKINNIGCSEYSIQDNSFIMALFGTTENEILTLDFTILTITTDIGDVVESFTGFTKPASLTKNLQIDGVFTYVLEQPHEDTSELLEEIRELQNSLTHVMPAVNNLISESVILADENSAKIRDIVSVITDVSHVLTIHDWILGMTTKPGDFVYSLDKSYYYMYSGKAKMTHSNPTFYPGASGVYYWALIPQTIDGIKVYPSLNGIIMTVKKDELWYDSSGEQIYKWNAEDWSDCSYAPGTVGVHQWVKM